MRKVNTLKICGICKKEKSFSNFFFKRKTLNNTKASYSASCKPCQTEESRERKAKRYRELMARKSIASPDKQKCNVCLKTKNNSMFYIRKYRINGLDVSCKDCMKQIKREWALNNPDKVCEYQKRWQKNNKARLTEYCKNYYRKLKKENPEKIRENSRKAYYKRKIKALSYPHK